MTPRSPSTRKAILHCSSCASMRVAQFRKSLGSLGLPAHELERHIAYDIGAEQVARGLSKRLDAPLVLQRYSRLVYDCNRPPEADQRNS